MAPDVFNARIAQANLVTKQTLMLNCQVFIKKIISNKTKHVLVEKGLKKLNTFDSSYFIGKSHFEKDVVQNYLVF